MPEKAPIEVVEIDSSDDNEHSVSVAENGNKNKPQKDAQLQLKTPKIEIPVAVAPPDSNYRPLDSRSFWKAGAYEIGPSQSTYVQGQFFPHYLFFSLFCFIIFFVFLVNF